MQPGCRRNEQVQCADFHKTRKNESRRNGFASQTFQVCTPPISATISIERSPQSCFNRPMKPYKQQLIDAKSARAGITDQKSVSPNSRAKRRLVILRAFVPPILGRTDATWQTAGKYLDRKTAQLRANALAKSDWLYRHATSWTIDGEPYTPSTLNIVEPTTSPMG